MTSLDDWWKERVIFPDRAIGPEDDVIAAMRRTKADLTILIDGDIVAYRASAAAEGTYYMHPFTLDRRFKYHKDIVKYLEKMCKSKDDIKKIKKMTEPEPLGNALHNVHKTIDKIYRSMKDMYKADDIRIKVYLTGNENFRTTFDPTYKAHRKDEKPYHLLSCKQLLLTHYGARLEEGLEADDLMGIDAYKFKGHYAELGRCVIATTDKDLLCISGDHWDWTKGKMTKNGRWGADRFFYTQCLIGDSTDNVKGCKRIGPVTAKRITDPIHAKDHSTFVKRLYLTVLHHYIYSMRIAFEKEMKIEPSADELQTIATSAKARLHNDATLLWIMREDHVLWTPPCLTSRRMLHVMATTKAIIKRKPKKKEEEAEVPSVSKYVGEAFGREVLEHLELRAKFKKAAL